MGNPLASGKWPGYGKKFLAAIDAAMVVKPEDRPQSIADWLGTFGKSLEEDTETEDGSEDATRFIAQQVESDEIIPVGTTDASNLVETGVPTDPKQAKFKRIGRETTTSKKVIAPVEPPPPPEEEAADEFEDEEAVAAPVAAVAEKPARAKRDAEAKEPAGKPKTGVLVGAGAIALLGAVGAAAFLTRGGSSPEPTDINASTSVGGNADIILGNPDANQAVDANAAGNVAENAAAPAAAEQTNTTSDVQKEAARAAAAEARLAAMQKAQAKAAATAAAKAAQPITKTPTKSATTAAGSTASTAESNGGGVSSAKLSQFYGIVDSARSMAKQVMRSNNGANAALARSYDANLKTLRDSMRGVSSDKEADRLIKQASQTRAYVQFLVKQSQ
jgi:hypothetical protein